jgi:hypothetical protein
MHASATQIDHRCRVTRAMAHINRNLDRKISKIFSFVYASTGSE